jgi:hypothetical protein
MGQIFRLSHDQSSPFPELSCCHTGMFPEYLTEIALIFVAACAGDIKDFQISIFQKVFCMFYPFLCNVVKKILAGFLFEDVTDIGGIAADFPGEIMQVDAACQMLLNIRPDPCYMMPLFMAVCAGVAILE